MKSQDVKSACSFDDGSNLTIISGRLTPYELALKAQSRALPHHVEKTTHTEVINETKFPFWHDFERAIPNHLARSSLFAPIARQKKRHLMRDHLLFSRKDANIYFSGEQLDEADCDVWLQILHLVSKTDGNDRLEFIRANFLDSIGRTKCGPTYEWLEGSMSRLTLGMITIETNKYSIGRAAGCSALHLINGFDHCRDSGHYLVRIDKRIITLFSGKEFTRIDWKKRLQITKHKNMAKFLQRLICTSSDKKQRHSLADLKKLTCYNSQDSKFEESILGALKELERLGIISSPSIERNRDGAKYALWIR